MEDKELIQAILNGQTERYAEVVKAYQEDVSNLCYKICGARLDIEEITQQVFVELYYALPRFQYQAKLRTYIYRITVNVVSKALARGKRITPQEDETVFDRKNDEPNVEEAIIRQERLRQLRKCMGLLKPEQRTALALYTYNDLSYKEIADVMQITLSKVETLIYRAKQNIKKMIEKANAQ